jgi:hypothetical protein
LNGLLVPFHDIDVEQDAECGKDKNTDKDFGQLSHMDHPQPFEEQHAQRTYFSA